MGSDRSGACLYWSQSGISEIAQFAARNIRERRRASLTAGIALAEDARGFPRGIRRALENFDGRAQIVVDLCNLVIQHRITMKTATVRDLRNRFADVAKWIEHGEAVTITRNGAAFATLAPAKTAKPSKAAFVARYRDFKPVGRKLNKAETEAFWSALRD